MAGLIRFYLDDHIDRALAVALRRDQFDVMTAAEAGMSCASDEAHLSRALAEGRVFVTKDADFTRLNKQGLSHAGIAFFTRQADVGEMYHRLSNLAARLDADQMRMRIEFL